MALSGWHLLIILGTLLLFVALIAGGVVLGLYIVRKTRPAGLTVASNATDAAAPVSAADLRAARLTELTELSERGLLSLPEYEARRAAILDEI